MGSRAHASRILAWSRAWHNAPLLKSPTSSASGPSPCPTCMGTMRTTHEAHMRTTQWRYQMSRSGIQQKIRCDIRCGAQERGSLRSPSSYREHRALRPTYACTYTMQAPCTPIWPRGRARCPATVSNFLAPMDARMRRPTLPIMGMMAGTTPHYPARVFMTTRRRHVSSGSLAAWKDSWGHLEGSKRTPIQTHDTPEPTLLSRCTCAPSPLMAKSSEAPSLPHAGRSDSFP